MGCSLNCGECPFNPNDKKNLKWVSKIKNDYELAIRLSKDLEFILETQFDATRKGLHQKITSAKQNYFRKTNRHFSSSLERNMRRLATIRNKLIHNRDYNEINDKAAFIQTFKDSHAELQGIITEMHSKGKGKPSDDCVIL